MSRYHVGENNACIHPILEGWIYIIPIHGPLDGPRHKGSIYSNTTLHCDNLLLSFAVRTFSFVGRLDGAKVAATRIHSNYVRQQIYLLVLMS